MKKIRITFFLLFFLFSLQVFGENDFYNKNTDQSWTVSYNDPIELTEEIIQKTNTFWIPIGYYTISAQINIGFNAVQYGGAYILLESPQFVVDLVSGGFCKVASSVSYDLLIEIIESSVRTPKKVCKKISRAMIFEGFENYKIAYKIARKYLDGNELTRDEAIQFLNHRWGVFKMSNANLLQANARSGVYKIKNQLAEIATMEMLQILEDKYQSSIDNKLPLIYAAKFVKDINDIMIDWQLGLSNYPPYKEFLANNDMLNELQIRENEKWKNLPEFDLKDVFKAIEDDDFEKLKFYFSEYYIDPNSVQEWKKQEEWYDDLFSLISVASTKGNLEIVKFLIAQGADVNQYDKSCYARGGSYPIFQATIYNHPDIVEFLIKNNANVNVSDGAENSPITSASSRGHTEIVRLLLDNGANPNDTMELGFSALYFGASQGHFDIVKMLLKSGASIENKWHSSLSAACECGDFEIVKYLVNNGADVNFGQEDYKPLDYARMNNHRNVIEYLKSKGAE